MVLELGGVLDGKKFQAETREATSFVASSCPLVSFFCQNLSKVGYPGMTDLFHGTFKSLDFIQELAGQGKNFDHFVAFDKAKCTVKLGCEQGSWRSRVLAL